MTPSEITSIIIAGLSLFFNLIVTLKRGSTQAFDQHIGYKLTSFKIDLIGELKALFINAKETGYEFQLRDERITSLRESLNALDHRTTRNSQLISNLFELALKNRHLDKARHEELTKDDNR